MVVFRDTGPKTRKFDFEFNLSKTARLPRSVDQKHNKEISDFNHKLKDETLKSS